MVVPEGGVFLLHLIFKSLGSLFWRHPSPSPLYVLLLEVGHRFPSNCQENGITKWLVTPELGWGHSCWPLEVWEEGKGCWVVNQPPVYRFWLPAA